MGSKKKNAPSTKALLKYFRKAAEIQGKASQESIEAGRCYQDGQAYYSLLWYFNHEIDLDLDRANGERYSALLDAYLGADLPEITHPKKLKKKQIEQIKSLLEEGFPNSSHPLNDNQTLALCKALTYPISFIQGPPGTGKTEVILRIAAMVLAQGGKVAVVSTNAAAVENVESKIEATLRAWKEDSKAGKKPNPNDLAYKASTQMVKLGSATKRAAAVGPVHHEALRFVKGEHVFPDGASIIGWEQNKRFDEFLDDYPLVTSTVHSLKKCFADGDERKYDLLIVDEASQMNLVVGIVALSCAKRAVFVGDTFQLPPVSSEDQIKLLSKYARKQKLFTKKSPSPFDMSREDWSFLSSCYEVFVGNNPELHTLLTEHYRCHPAIIGFSNKFIYEDNLVIHELDWMKEVPCPISIRWYRGDYRERMWPSTPLPSEEQPNKKTRATCVNEKQLTILREEELPRLARLLSNGKTVCMLSPFRGQIYRLREMLAFHLREIISEDDMAIETIDDEDESGYSRNDANSNRVSSPVALTIHKSQGQEFDVVYLFPVEDGNWEWPWSQGMRLVNVAVTRAKSELHIILSTKLMSARTQKSLAGKVAYVTQPAREEDDAKRQQLYVRKLVDYTIDFIDELDEEAGAKQQTMTDPYWYSYGLHETNVVSVFDEIPYTQDPKRKGSDFTPEILVGNALRNMRVANVVVKNGVRFADLHFANGDTLSDRCGERYTNADEAHFDFVVCEERTGQVLVAIEVDGPHHRFKASKGTPVISQIIMDRKKDGVVRDICDATPALLAWDHRRKCRTKQAHQSTAADSLQICDDDASDRFTPEVEWLCYPSLVPNDSSFVFLRIPSDGSTYCEFEAMKASARNLPPERADGSKRFLPPTVEEYLLKQRRINGNQTEHRNALFVDVN